MNAQETIDFWASEAMYGESKLHPLALRNFCREAARKRTPNLTEQEFDIMWTAALERAGR